MANDSAHQQLLAIGFNRLEAEVYVFLLASRPTTAYGIGKKLGRPTANVYKAVEALSRRGAVLIEGGENRLCRAVPAEEFLDQMNREFCHKTKEAAEKLAKLERPTEDERAYRLESAPLLLERCRQMLEERCERCVVIDAFPRALDAILPSIRIALRRGVTVYVEAYAPIDIPGANVAVTELGDKVLNQWRSQQLNVVIDGRESLTGLLDTGLTEVFQGLWTDSRYLSLIMHSGRLAEHTMVRLRNAVAAGSSCAELESVLISHPFLLHTDVPGHGEMLARYAGNSDEEVSKSKKGKTHAKEKGIHSHADRARDHRDHNDSRKIPGQGR
jgi:sugar-specific transcriptional regulator TrmB